MSKVLCNRNMLLRVKGKVYKTCIRPAMLYEIESACYKNIKKESLIAEISMLHFTLELTRKDKVLVKLTYIFLTLWFSPLSILNRIFSIFNNKPIIIQ